MANPQVDAKVEIPIVGDTSDVNDKVKKVKENAKKDPVTLPVEIDLSEIKKQLGDISDSLKNNLGKISKSIGEDFAGQFEKAIGRIEESIDDFSTNSNKGLERIKDAVNDISDAFNDLISTSKDGQKSLKVAGTAQLLHQLKNINGQLETIGKTAKSVDILPDIDKKKKEIENYNKEISILSENINKRKSKSLNWEVEFDKDRFKKNISKLVSISEDQFSSAGPEILKKTEKQLDLISEYALKTGDYSKQIRFGDGEKDLISIRDLLDSIINKIYTLKTEGTKSFADILNSREIGSVAGNKLIQALGNIKYANEEVDELQKKFNHLTSVESSKGGTMGFKPEDIDKITSSFTKLESVLKEINTTLNSFDIKRIDPLKKAAEAAKPVISTRSSTQSAPTAYVSPDEQTPTPAPKPISEEEKVRELLELIKTSDLASKSVQELKDIWQKFQSINVTKIPQTQLLGMKKTADSLKETMRNLGYEYDNIAKKWKSIPATVSADFEEVAPGLRSFDSRKYEGDIDKLGKSIEAARHIMFQKMDRGDGLITRLLFGEDGNLKTYKTLIKDIREDLLDANYAMFREVEKTGDYSKERFASMAKTAFTRYDLGQMFGIIPYNNSDLQGYEEIYKLWGKNNNPIQGMSVEYMSLFKGMVDQIELLNTIKQLGEEKYVALLKEEREIQEEIAKTINVDKNKLDVKSLSSNETEATSQIGNIIKQKDAIEELISKIKAFRDKGGVDIIEEDGYDSFARLESMIIGLTEKRQSIEAFESQVKEAGYTFDETANKWKKLVTSIENTKVSSDLFTTATDLKELRDRYQLLRNINNDIKVYENPDNYINTGMGKTFAGFNLKKTGSGYEELKSLKKQLLELNPLLNEVADSTERISKRDFENMFGSKINPAETEFLKQAKDIKELSDQYSNLVMLNNRLSEMNPDSNLAKRAQKERENILKLNPILEEYANHTEMLASRKELQARFEQQNAKLSLIEEPSGQLALFDNIIEAEEKATEGAKEMGEAISKATEEIPGQMSFDSNGNIIKTINSYQELKEVLEEMESIYSKFKLNKYRETNTGDFVGNYNSSLVDMSKMDDRYSTSENLDMIKNKLLEIYELYNKINSAIKHNRGYLDDDRYDTNDLEKLKKLFKSVAQAYHELVPETKRFEKDFTERTGGVPKNIKTLKQVTRSMAPEFKQLTDEVIANSAECAKNQKLYEKEAVVVEKANESLRKRYDLLRDLVDETLRVNINDHDKRFKAIDTIPYVSEFETYESDFWREWGTNLFDDIKNPLKEISEALGFKPTTPIGITPEDATRSESNAQDVAEDFEKINEERRETSEASTTTPVGITADDAGQSQENSDKVVESMTNIREEASKLASELDKLFSNMLSNNFENVAQFGKNGILGYVAGNFSDRIASSKLYSSLLDTVNDNIITSMHNHVSKGADYFSVEDLKPITESGFFENGLKSLGLLTKDKFKLIDFSGVSKDIAEKIIKEYAEALNIVKSSSEFLNLDQNQQRDLLRPVLSGVLEKNNLSGLLKEFNTSDTSAIANALLNIKNNATETIDPIEKVINLVEFGLEKKINREDAGVVRILELVKSGAFDAKDAFTALSNIVDNSNVLSINSELEKSQKFVKKLSSAAMNYRLRGTEADSETMNILSKYKNLEMQNPYLFGVSAKSIGHGDNAKWAEFLATLPEAHKYLQSIGYDFERISEEKKETSEVSETNPVGVTPKDATDSDKNVVGILEGFDKIDGRRKESNELATTAPVGITAEDVESSEKNAQGILEAFNKVEKKLKEDKSISNINLGFKEVGQHAEDSSSQISNGAKEVAQNLHLITDELGNIKIFYRGLQDSMGQGLVSDRFNGATFWTDSFDLAKEYANWTKVESANLSMIKPLEIQGNGANWDNIEYLGTGIDEASKKIIAAKKKMLEDIGDMQRIALEEGFNFKDITSDFGMSEFRRYMSIMMKEMANYPEEIQEDTKRIFAQVEEGWAEYKAISDDINNIYGRHNTKEFVSLAQQSGQFDGVIFKNIVDSASGIVRDATNVVVQFNEDKIKFIETINASKNLNGRDIGAITQRYGELVGFIDEMNKRGRVVMGDYDSDNYKNKLQKEADLYTRILPLLSKYKDELISIENAKIKKSKIKVSKEDEEAMLSKILEDAKRLNQKGAALTAKDVADTYKWDEFYEMEDKIRPTLDILSNSKTTANDLIELAQKLYKEEFKNVLINEEIRKLKNQQIEELAKGITTEYNASKSLNTKSSAIQKEAEAHQEATQAAEKQIETERELDSVQDKQSDVGNQEAKSFENLIEILDRVKTAVDEKTDAFTRERAVVEGEVQREVTTLTALSGWLGEVKDVAEKLSAELSTLGSKNNLSEIYSDLKNVGSLDGQSKSYSSLLNSIAIRKEAQALPTLIPILDKITKAIENKNKAFEQEGEIVNKVATKETSNLSDIIDWVELLKDSIKELKFGNSINNVESLKDLYSNLKNVQNLDPSKFASLSTSLKNFNDGLGNLKLDDSSMLTTIERILQKGDALKALAESVKKGAGAIKDAGQATGATSTLSDKDINALYSERIRNAQKILSLKDTNIDETNDIRKRQNQEEINRLMTANLEIYNKLNASNAIANNEIKEREFAKTVEKTNIELKNQRELLEQGTANSLVIQGTNLQNVVKKMINSLKELANTGKGEYSDPSNFLAGVADAVNKLNTGLVGIKNATSLEDMDFIFKDLQAVNDAVKHGHSEQIARNERGYNADVTAQKQMIKNLEEINKLRLANYKLRQQDSKSNVDNTKMTQNYRKIKELLTENKNLMDSMYNSSANIRPGVTFEEDFRQAIEKSNQALRDQRDLLNAGSQDKFAVDLARSQDKVQKMIGSLEQIETMGKGKFTDKFNLEISDAITKLKGEFDKMGEIDSPDKLNEKMKELQKTFDNIKMGKKLAENIKIGEISINKLLEKIEKFKAKNSAMGKEFAAQYDDLNKRLERAVAVNDPMEFKSVVADFARLNTEVEKAGKTGLSFIDKVTGRISDLNSRFLAYYFSWMDWIRYIRQTFTLIKDLDYQLVDLRKTTTMNTEQLNEFYQNSSDVARQMGVTTSELIQQSSAWSRLGYSSKEAATEMAQLSSQFTSISPGMTAEESTDYLVSIMKAFNVDVEDVESKVLDSINRIGNTFATSNKEIGEMLLRSSAAMKEANNTLEETIALESAAVQVTRNAESTGTAFRTKNCPYV